MLTGTELAQLFFTLLQSKIIYNFVIFVATKKKVGKQIFLPPPLLLLLYPGSEIRDGLMSGFWIRYLG